MQRFISYSLIFLLIVHTLFQVFIVGDYILNQDFIAKNLCENIEKPELKCNGKCHLTKQLKTTETSDTNQTNPSFEFSAFIEVPITDFVSMTEQIFDEPNEEYFKTSNIILSGVNSKIFHPPC
jgi:hypothetical protein